MTASGLPGVLVPLQVRAWPKPPPAASVGQREVPRRLLRGLRPRPSDDENVVVAVAVDDSPARRLALLGALVVVDGAVVREALYVPEGMPAGDAAGWRRLRRLAAGFEAATGPGMRKQVELGTLRHFSVEVLRRHVLRGKRPLVAADVAAVLVAVAEYVGPARKAFRDGWALGFPGWGCSVSVDTARGTAVRWQALKHCPRAYVAAAGADGAFIRFGSCGVERAADGTVTGLLGPWERTADGSIRPFAGRFHSVCRGAWALGAVDGTLGDACAAFAVPYEPACYVPGRVDGAMVAAVRAELVAVHRLHGALLDEAGRW